MIKPKEIQQFPSGELGIIWEDDHASIFSGEELRKACPCALCVHDLKKGLGIHPSRFIIKRIRPIGNYAIGIQWADNHDTGIYGYEELRKLCGCEICKPQKA